MNQRAPARQQGLPANACAPDLFSRIDELKPARKAHADFPVRWFLGFSTEMPSLNDIRPQSWLAKIKERFYPKPAESLWTAIPSIVLLQMLFLLVWSLGFFADVVALVKIGPGGCDDERLKEIKADIAAKELVSRIVGTNPAYATAIDELARNYICPTQTVSAGEAVSAYLADVIDVQAVKDYGAAGNICPFATEVSVQTAQARLGADQYLELARRGKITDEEADAQIRQLGFLRSEYVQWMRELNKWLPDASTFVSWMRRGTTHEQPATGLDLDHGFADAYGDNEKAWAKNAGLTDEQVKWLWRSQFQPVDVETAKQWYRWTQAGLLPGKAAFTEEDLALAVRQSAIPPAYWPTVLGSVYTPLGMRQLKTAYEANVIDETAVLQGLVADGFSPKEAEILLTQWAKDKPAARRRKIGATGSGGFIKLYAEGVIGERELAGELAALGMTADEGQEALIEARAGRMRNHRKELLGLVKGQYMKGAIDDTTLAGVLGSIGIGADNAADLLRLWRTEFELSPRPDAAAELGKSFASGYISEPEYVAALTQLRFTPAQIARILEAAGAQKASEALKQAEKLVDSARKRMTREEKEWAGEIARAEKMYGKVSQRTKTNAGKLMGWIGKAVAGPHKPVSKRGSPPESPDVAAAFEEMPPVTEPIRPDESLENQSEPTNGTTPST